MFIKVQCCRVFFVCCILEEMMTKIPGNNKDLSLNKTEMYSDDKMERNALCLDIDHTILFCSAIKSIPKNENIYTYILNLDINVIQNKIMVVDVIDKICYYKYNNINDFETKPILMITKTGNHRYCHQIYLRKNIIQFLKKLANMNASKHNLDIYLTTMANENYSNMIQYLVENVIFNTRIFVK